MRFFFCCCCFPPPLIRAHVLARFDGVESVGRIVGTALSPVIFDALGYYGSYGIRSAIGGGVGGTNVPSGSAKNKTET